MLEEHHKHVFYVKICKEISHNIESKSDTNVVRYSRITIYELLEIALKNSVCTKISPKIAVAITRNSKNLEWKYVKM